MPGSGATLVLSKPDPTTISTVYAASCSAKPYTYESCNVISYSSTHQGPFLETLPIPLPATPYCTSDTSFSPHSSEHPSHPRISTSNSQPKNHNINLVRHAGDAKSHSSTPSILPQCPRRSSRGRGPTVIDTRKRQTLRRLRCHDDDFVTRI